MAESSMQLMAAIRRNNLCGVGSAVSRKQRFRTYWMTALGLAAFAAAWVYLAPGKKRLTIVSCRLVHLPEASLRVGEGEWPLGRGVGVEYRVQESGADLVLELRNGSWVNVYDARSSSRALSLEELRTRMAGRKRVEVQGTENTVVIRLDEGSPSLGSVFVAFEENRFQGSATFPLAQCIEGRLREEP